MPFCCFEGFWGKFIENFSFNIKVTIAEMSTDILRKLFFSYHIAKGANPVENLDLFKQQFLIKPVKGDKY